MGPETRSAHARSSCSRSRRSRRRSRWSRRWLALCSSLPLAVGALAACSNGASSAPAAPAPAPAPVGPPGLQVYAQSCARCHGYDGAPMKSGTPALTTAKIAGTGDQMLAILIRSGKGQMPAFGALTDGQIADLIVYLRRL